MNMGDVGVEPDFLGSDGRCRLGFARQDKRAITLASKGVPADTDTESRESP